MGGRLPAVILLMCVLPWTHGLKCYQCGNRYEESCEDDPFDVASLTATECGDNADIICTKYKEITSAGQYIQRGCVSRFSFSDQTSCERKELQDGTIVERCYCESDSCNGGHLTSASMAALTILAASTILLLGGAGCVSS